MNLKVLLFLAAGVLLVGCKKEYYSNNSSEVKSMQKEKQVLPSNIPSIEGKETFHLNGLEYWKLNEGQGESPKKGTRVTVNYTGWLTDGTKFDSSFDRNVPFEFNLGGGVIDGWNMMVAQMKKGDRILVKIPAILGYGVRGVGPIPGGATLFFEIELLDF